MATPRNPILTAVLAAFLAFASAERARGGDPPAPGRGDGLPADAPKPPLKEGPAELRALPDEEKAKRLDAIKKEYEDPDDMADFMGRIATENQGRFANESKP